MPGEREREREETPTERSLSYTKKPRVCTCICRRARTTALTFNYPRRRPRGTQAVITNVFIEQRRAYNVLPITLERLDAARRLIFSRTRAEKRQRRLFSCTYTPSGSLHVYLFRNFIRLVAPIDHTSPHHIQKRVEKC